MTTNNKDYSREYMRKKRLEDPDLNKRYYESHKEQMKASSKAWYDKNKEKRLERIREYHKENRDIAYKAYKKWRPGYQKERLKTDPKFKLDDRVLRAVRNALKTSEKFKEQIWIAKLGYKMATLKNHLKARVPDGYTWTDYINGKLELDHVIPRYLFNYESIDDPEFKKCWALKNLRLLPSNKNKLNYFTGFKCKELEESYT